MNKTIILIFLILAILNQSILSFRLAEDFQKEDKGAKRICYNTEKLLRKKPEQVIHCAKQLFYKEPEVLPDSEIRTYDITDNVTVIEYEKVSSIVWPYYPEDHPRDEDDIEPFNWFHNVRIFIPKGVELSETAQIQVVGGSNLPEPEDFESKYPDKLAELLYKSNDRNAPSDNILAVLAEQIQGVVIRLNHVPNQPMLIDGSYEVEDGIIAYTWRKFIENAQKYTYFPLHLPMAAATTEIMTWAQDILLETQGIRIKNFIISGESKRGWTTWMTALMDDRVSAIVPIVIDILNVERQFDDINKVYAGKWPIALYDYNNQGVTNYKNFVGEKNENFFLMNKVIDPLAYKFQETERLSIPKYVINAANDEFFLPNAGQVYMKALPNQEQTFVRNVQNCGHRIDKQFDRVVYSIAQFFNTVSNNQSFPGLIVQEDITNESIELSITYVCNQCQENDQITATLWVANNEIARDFRMLCLEEYQEYFPEQAGNTGFYEATELNLTRKENSNEYSVQVSVDVPEQGWRNVLVEFVDAQQFGITTEVYVLQGKNTTPNNLMPQQKEMDDGSVQPLLMCNVMETNRSLV